MDENKIKFNFRLAQKEDCKLIAEKIRELAKFEGHPGNYK